MVDPLAEIVSLLKPRAGYGKIAVCSGRWRVTRVLTGEPFYGVILEGGARMTVEDHGEVLLQAGDFILVPSLRRFSMESLETEGPVHEGPPVPGMLPGEVRHGDPAAPVNSRLLAGHFHFGSPDSSLLVSLLPRLLHLRGADRLTALLHLVTDETRALRPAREMILARLLDVVLIEALRAAPASAAASGILRGLADERLAISLRRLHENPAFDWTMEAMAQEAALSRSAFYKRFRAALGVPPMEYLTAWRMALAKDHLQAGGLGMQEIAEKVGYGSASAFSTAFTRYVGVAPSRFGTRAEREGVVEAAE